jgi:hypothetical protein
MAIHDVMNIDDVTQSYFMNKIAQNDWKKTDQAILDAMVGNGTDDNTKGGAYAKNLAHDIALSVKYAKKDAGIKESVDLDEGIVSKTLTGLVDKGLHKVLDKLEKMTGKHLGFVQKSNIPSAGKDNANTAFHWSADALVTGEKLKKEAEDFHRKAKKQWTWSSNEIEAGFQYYGHGKIPDDKVKFVNRVQADIRKIIDMHTKLESMMQTTGNSPTYQRTMEKLESDTKRVFKDIDDGGIGAIGGKYRAMQGMDNLKKAKKMTHKEPRQTSPVKFRAYANMGEEKSFSEFKNELEK